MNHPVTAAGTARGARRELELRCRGLLRVRGELLAQACERVMQRGALCSSFFGGDGGTNGPGSNPAVVAERALEADRELPRHAELMKRLVRVAAVHVDGRIPGAPELMADRALRRADDALVATARRATRRRALR